MANPTRSVAAIGTLCVLVVAQPSAWPDSRSAGAWTIRDASRNAFRQPVPGLGEAERAAFATGEAFFNTDFDASQASRRSGLGPRFNAASCAACHNGGGRGVPVGDDGEASPALVLQLSEFDPTTGRPGPSARWGAVLNPFALPGTAPEGQLRVTYADRPVELRGGDRLSLRVPTYSIVATTGTVDPARLRVSPRMAPAIVGAGLIDAVPAREILARADPLDADGDGISGRPNWLPAPGDRFGSRATRLLGRFGWKANQPSLAQQVAHALANEMGVTSALQPFEDGARPGMVGEAAAAARVDLSQPDFDAIVGFQRWQAVPGRRDAGAPAVRAGARVFLEFGCESCHRASLRTGTVPGMPASSRQTIRPYTDLLLHDMGPGLADGRSDGEASGHEWRTAPLWGLGLTGTVSRRVSYLHDGRARSLSEAILWHGGEAASPARRFANASEDERRALLAFLQSL